MFDYSRIIAALTREHRRRPGCLHPEAPRSAVGSSALFRRKAPEQGTGRSQRRDSRRRSRRERLLQGRLERSGKRPLQAIVVLFIFITVF